MRKIKIYTDNSKDCIKVFRWLTANRGDFDADLGKTVITLFNMDNISEMFQWLTENVPKEVTEITTNTLTLRLR